MELSILRMIGCIIEHLQKCILVSRRVNLQQLVVIDCSKNQADFHSTYTDPANASKVIVQSGNLPGRSPYRQCRVYGTMSMTFS
ncbi:MAG: hypothetical protein IPP42_01570 [Saprospiraceae bacterium]|nr:hypothetical protein [Saprospiraceae bacterium]